jgi:methylmalonyl-CoA mutase
MSSVFREPWQPDPPSDFLAHHAAATPAMLEKLKQTVIEDGNVFAVLVEAVKSCSLGQISTALYQVGG